MPKLKKEEKERRINLGKSFYKLKKANIKTDPTFVALKEAKTMCRTHTQPKEEKLCKEGAEKAYNTDYYSNL